jgi:anti-anti-sigma factor
MTDFSNESFTIDVADDGTIVVKGDLDMAAGPILDATIAEREEQHPVVIDLANVQFIDSSGLRSLLDASRRAHVRDSEVVLRSVGPEVGRLLEITGTAGQFRIDHHDA